MLSSIKIKVLASQLALVLLAISSMWIASYYLMVSYLNISQKRNLQYFADFKVKEVENYFTRIKTLAEIAADNREFKDFPITARNLALIELFTKFNQIFPAATYVNKEGQEEVKVVKGKLSDRPLVNISQGPVFQDSLRQRNKVVISPVTPSPELGEPVILLMLSKYGYFGDEFIGTLVGAVPISKIRALLEDKVGETGFICLIDRNGNILSYPQKDKVFTEITGKGKAAEKLISDSKRLNSGFGRANILGLDGFVAYAPLKETGWSLLVILPYQEFMAEPNNLKKITVVIFIAILIITTIVSFSLTSGMTDPLLKLVTVVNSIAKGSFSKKVEVRSKDEVGQLASAFNSMTENLEKIVVSRDELIKEVAERKRIEESLRESEDYLKTIFNSLQIGIIIVDAETRRIVNVNPVAVKLFGAPKEKIVDVHCHKFICPAEEGKCPIIDLHQEVDNAERVLVMANGEKLPVLKTVVTIMLRNRKFLLESFIDISERKKVEEEREVLIKELKERQELLKRQKQEVEDSRRAIKNVAEDLMESKEILEYQKKFLEDVNKELDDFTYIVSHDLKEPLRSIDAYSKFIVDDYQDKLGEEGRHYLERIRANTERMKKLIEDLLEISRIKKKGSSIEEVETEGLIGEAKMRLEYAIKQKGVEIIVKDKLPKIFCDSVRLTEVFLNLISNAIKFNDKPKPVIEIGYNNKEDLHEFYIKDNGAGIKEEYFDKIFEIFQRLGKREDSEGTGAGLTIVKKIVQMHKGKIWLESKIGEGSAFYFTIPKEKSVILGKKLIGEILVEKKLVTEEDIKRALEEQERIGRINKGGEQNGRNT